MGLISYSHFVSPWKEDVSPSPSFYMLPRCYNDPNNVITLFKDVQKEFFDYVERDSTEEPESIRNLDVWCPSPSLCLGYNTDLHLLCIPS